MMWSEKHNMLDLKTTSSLIFSGQNPAMKNTAQKNSINKHLSKDYYRATQDM